MSLQSLGSDVAFGGSVLVAQLLALQIMRRALAARDDRDEAPGWRSVGAQWRLAHAQMLRQQQSGLVLGSEDAATLTRHERRLLRATAAAQAGDPTLVDNIIFALAPGRLLRPVLAEAVERLAAALTALGHRLPPSPMLATYDVH